MLAVRVLVLAILASLLPTSWAQSGEDFQVMLEDPKDDAFFFLTLPAGDRMPVPSSPAFDGPDLHQVALRDDVADLVVRVSFHAPENPLDPRGPVWANVTLDAGGSRYLVELERYGAGLLYSVDALGFLHQISELEGRIVDGRIWEVRVPRVLLLDPTGAPPERQSTLGVVGADALSGYTKSGSQDLTLHDLAAGPADYVFRTGIEQTGDGRLVLPIRSVASNGETAAHAYPFEVRNIGDAPHSFELVVSDLPAESWTPSFTRQELRLDAGAVHSDTLVVTVPFAHNHGERDTFLLTLRQLDAAGEAVAELGVYYFAIPQPTGHHDTLWIHARERSSSPDQSPVFGDGHELSMNTLAEDPDSAAIPVSANGGLAVPHGEYHWRVPMSPELGMPLSFRPDGVGHLRAAFSSNAPQMNAQLSARLSIQGLDLTLVEFPPVPIDLGNGPANADLPGTVVAPFIAPQRGQNLLLTITMTADNMDASSLGAQLPSLEPGAELQLPLLEYRASTGAAESPELRLDLGERSLRVAPGASARLDGYLENRGAGPLAAEVAVQGVNADWFEPVDGLQLAPGETLPLALRVNVPVGAQEGDLADVIVRVTRDGGSSVSERLLVVVAADGLTGAGQDSAAGKGAPGIPVVLVLAALAIAMAARRQAS